MKLKCHCSDIDFLLALLLSSVKHRQIHHQEIPYKFKFIIKMCKNVCPSSEAILC